MNLWRPELRVLVLWQGMSGYFDACLRRLAATDGVEISLVYEAATSAAPFDAQNFAWLRGAYEWRGAPSAQRLAEITESFAPDVILVSSWHIRPYRRIIARRPDAVRVLCMDNQWLERPKQWLGRVGSHWYVQRLFDAVFLPGDRQALFARHLGFTQNRILRGLYCADDQKYSRVRTPVGDRPPSFLFVGRLVEEKGLDTLLIGYADYRRCNSAPWDLHIAGTGPLLETCQGAPGVTMHGFVQPADLPALLEQARCFVLPSRFEPWGVVIHEATLAGLAVIASDAVGAVAHLVQDGFNGYVVPPGSPAAVAAAMSRVAALDDSALSLFSGGSRALANQFTTARWSSYLLEGLAEAAAAKRMRVRMPSV